MKKFIKFLSILGVIVMLFSLSLISPNAAQAGSLSNTQISLSSYDIAPATSNATFVFTPATAVNTGDGIQINFPSDFNISNIVNGDVAVTQTNSGTDITKGTASVSGQNLQIPITTESDTPAGTITITVSNSHITNTTTDGSKIFTITTWDLGTDGAFGGTGGNADTLEDTGVAAIYINTTGGNQITITGTVDPVLTMALSTNTCNLGTLRTDAFKSCGYDLTVGTNAINGYDASIKSDGDLRYGSYVIHREADGTDSTYGNNGKIDTHTLTDSEYGVAVDTTDTSDVYSNASIGSGKDYANCAGVDSQNAYDVSVGSLNATTAQRIAYATAAVDASSTGITHICHVAKISGVQAPGAYTQIVTLTVVGNF